MRGIRGKRGRSRDYSAVKYDGRLPQLSAVSFKELRRDLYVWVEAFADLHRVETINWQPHNVLKGRGSEVGLLLDDTDQWRKLGDYMTRMLANKGYHFVCWARPISIPVPWMPSYRVSFIFASGRAIRLIPWWEHGNRYNVDISAGTSSTPVRDRLVYYGASGIGVKDVVDTVFC